MEQPSCRCAALSARLAAPLQRLRLSAVSLWIFTIQQTEISACICLVIYLVAPFLFLSNQRLIAGCHNVCRIQFGDF